MTKPESLDGSGGSGHVGSSQTVPLDGTGAPSSQTAPLDIAGATPAPTAPLNSEDAVSSQNAQVEGLQGSSLVSLIIYVIARLIKVNSSNSGRDEEETISGRRSRRRHGRAHPPSEGCQNHAAYVRAILAIRLTHG